MLRRSLSMQSYERVCDRTSKLSSYQYIKQRIVRRMALY